MEPLKGGTLVNIPDDAGKILTSYNPDLSLASWGIRFAASLEGVLTVLSGVSSLEQLEDNLSYMKDFNPLTEDELKVIGDVVEIIKHSIAIPCTDVITVWMHALKIFQFQSSLLFIIMLNNPLNSSFYIISTMII